MILKLIDYCDLLIVLSKQFIYSRLEYFFNYFNDLINRKYELKPVIDEFNQVDKDIKRIVGEREKIITGEYIIQRKCIKKQSYTVAERTEYRIQIKKL